MRAMSKMCARIIYIKPSDRNIFLFHHFFFYSQYFGLQIPKTAKNRTRMNHHPQDKKKTHRTPYGKNQEKILGPMTKILPTSRARSYDTKSLINDCLCRPQRNGFASRKTVSLKKPIKNSSSGGSSCPKAVDINFRNVFESSSLIKKG